MKESQEQLPSSTAQRTENVSAAPPMAPEADLVADFKYLGLAVRSDGDDNAPKIDVGPAAIAARAAYARHSVDESANDGKQLHHKPDIDNLRQSSGGTNFGDHRSDPKDSFNATPHTHDRAQQRPETNNVDHANESLNYQGSTADIPSNPDTKDTITAEPVTHEIIKRQNHEIRQEVIEREIHEYHEFTKIQPVIETVVLPARHFIETADGQKVEIPAPKLATEADLYTPSAQTSVAHVPVAKVPVTDAATQ